MLIDRISYPGAHWDQSKKIIYFILLDPFFIPTAYFYPRGSIYTSEFPFFPIGPNRPQDERIYHLLLIMLSCWTHFVPLKSIFIPGDRFIHQNFFFFRLGPMGPWIANSICWYLFYLAGSIFYS